LDHAGINSGGMHLQLALVQPRFRADARKISAVNIDMALAQEDLRQIGEYVKEHISDWLAEQSLGKPPVVYEVELRERMVRVEEELKHQRELMRQGFERMDERFAAMREDMDKRFEQFDKRFEQVDKRFDQVDKRFEQVERRFEQVDKRFDDMLKRHDKHFLWLVGFIATGVGVVITAIRYL
jgi:ABC-type phosphate transport system auxiliary subunit